MRERAVPAVLVYGEEVDDAVEVDLRGHGEEVLLLDCPRRHVLHDDVRYLGGVRRILDVRRVYWVAPVRPPRVVEVYEEE